MATLHIESAKEDISPLVIMPGDPNRCEHIAKKFLSEYRLVNQVRGELAYTGLYKGVKVTIFSSGMGIPSMGIYSHELFTEYDVKAILRVGSAGTYSKDLNLNDLFLVESSYSESNYALNYAGSSDKIVYSSVELNDIVKETASEMGIDIKSGRSYSTEAFYTEEINIDSLVNEKSCSCVEMETFSLFFNARHNRKLSTALLTISDSFVTKEALTIEDRVNSFDKMIELALESIIKLA